MEQVRHPCFLWIRLKMNGPMAVFGIYRLDIKSASYESSDSSHLVNFSPLALPPSLQGACHDPALLQPLLELYATAPGSLPPKALSQLMYAASRLPLPAPPLLMQHIQDLTTATHQGRSGLSGTAATSPAVSARLLTMLLAWEGHDKAAAAALVNQLRSQMDSLQPHRAQSLRAAVLIAGLGVKL